MKIVEGTQALATLNEPRRGRMTPYKYIRNCWYVAGFRASLKKANLLGTKSRLSQLSFGEQMMGKSPLSTVGACINVFRFRKGDCSKTVF